MWIMSSRKVGAKMKGAAAERKDVQKALDWKINVTIICQY